ncbi:MAG: hypothetical protein GTO63_27095, partial [Anaerolineae bacterium]|nr:hypothetical protein [Anaerolineae bacterium]NIN98399.1 hypothetical protein [Anaerolineae bacterium]NIQ81315.1 hypothetical protein [Anaerolineae bacterium]
YVFFMALIFRVFGVYTLGSAIVIETAQLLMAAASCVIFYGLGTKMFNQKVGLFAALGLAFYPPSVFFSIMRIGPV